MSRGGFVHNRVLIDPLERAFRAWGARTVRECHVSVGERYGAVDLLAEWDHVRIAVEAELTVKRISGDLTKAASMRADELWIVVPNAPVVRSVRRKLGASPVPPEWLDVFVLTQVQALQRVTICSPLLAGA